MVSTLLLVSALSLGQFPEVPVGPEEEVQPVPPVDQPAEEHGDDEAAREHDARERAAREEEERAARERAMRDAEPVDEGDWAHEGKPASSARAFELRVLATTTLPMNISGVPSSGDWLFGLRGEFDLGHASTLFSWDHGAASLFNWSDTRFPTSYWDAMIGPSVWATRHNRIRLLGGVSAISSPGTNSPVITSGTTSGSTVRATRGVQFGPTIGATVHLGIPIISVEAAVLYTPIGFRQVDARAEAVLRLFVVELRGGYRARWVDSSLSATEIPVEPIYGPTFSLGLVF